MKNIFKASRRGNGKKPGQDIIYGNKATGILLEEASLNILIEDYLVRQESKKFHRQSDEDLKEYLRKQGRLRDDK